MQNVVPRLVGSDSDCMEFILPSFTNPREEYSLFVSKRDGSITCNCCDAMYRRKLGDVLNPSTSPALTCKHIRKLQRQFGEALKPCSHSN